MPLRNSVIRARWEIPFEDCVDCGPVLRRLQLPKKLVVCYTALSRAGHMRDRRAKQNKRC